MHTCALMFNLLTICESDSVVFPDDAQSMYRHKYPVWGELRYAAPPHLPTQTLLSQRSGRIPLDHWLRAVLVHNLELYRRCGGGLQLRVGEAWCPVRWSPWRQRAELVKAESDYGVWKGRGWKAGLPAVRGRSVRPSPLQACRRDAIASQCWHDVTTSFFCTKCWSNRETHPQTFFILFIASEPSPHSGIICWVFSYVFFIFN